ncbi:MAG: hypothetical protein AB7O48_06715 [Cyclobacteriaceae bacterium]
MTILSHRGVWDDSHQKNALDTLLLSLELGFGLETDIRDFNGKIVISHDMPTGDECLFERFLGEYQDKGFDLTLALNVKADGLQDDVMDLLQRYLVTNYFFFDMSVPDQLGYRKKGLNYLSRQSEYETSPSLYADSFGVWLDCFESVWYDKEVLERHLVAGKRVCVVSEELHGRSNAKQWELLRKMPFVNDNRLYLCTDFPQKANEYFL